LKFLRHGVRPIQTIHAQREALARGTDDKTTVDVALNPNFSHGPLLLPVAGGKGKAAGSGMGCLPLPFPP